MLKAFRISYFLQNTYRVNSMIYSLKQIPLIGRLLPSALYGSRGLNAQSTASAFCGRYCLRFSANFCTCF